MPGPHVAIVGAGPAGAVLAHLLATRGVSVSLLERQRDFAREFRGEALMPSGIRVLDSLDLGSALEKVPQNTPTHFEISTHGRVVLELDASSFVRAMPRIISQPDSWRNLN